MHPFRQSNSPIENFHLYLISKEINQSKLTWYLYCRYLDQNLQVEIRTAEQVTAYGRRLKGKSSLAARLRALAPARSEEGYMAELRQESEGDYLLIENHCPVCSAARACQGLCTSELEVFQRVLGPHVTVVREDHILAGARRCAYRVQGRS